MENTTTYAITHYSEMTDITLYFLCENKQNLLNSEQLITDFINSETATEFETNTKKLQEKGITHYNNEFISEKELPKMEILKTYSYRF
jgi:hypothetical protein